MKKRKRGGSGKEILAGGYVGQWHERDSEPWEVRRTRNCLRWLRCNPQSAELWDVNVSKKKIIQSQQKAS